jgi:UDPglucose 6-dehydrogenase
MDIGFVGLGKLGLPIALAVEAGNHSVTGCDPALSVAETLATRRMSYRERGAQALLERSRLSLVSLPEVVRLSRMIFVTIQTPHGPEHEGITRLRDDRADFDYSFLRKGIADLAAEIERVGEERVVVVVSTVLPGTIRREILPLLGPRARLCYNPFFIAMGTAIQDFLHPEFVLLGVGDEVAADLVSEFYGTLLTAPIFRTTIENAEIIKVLYNTFISTKIAFANTAMEFCHRVPGGNVDVVLDALKLGRDRIISPRYFSGGMGDGGACHPRDNIALSGLARRLGMSFDWFESVMLQRERQTDWLAHLVETHAAGRDVVILGRSFKPESNISTGSPALLLLNVLEERGRRVRSWDPHIDPPDDVPRDGPFCYFIGTNHPSLRDFPFEPGSVVIDPWRFVAAREGVEIVRVGDRTGS